MAQHEFDPGYTGLSTRCNRLVADAEGYGRECGRLMDDPVHVQRHAHCSGCLTGHDIGLPSSKVAYAHPACPVHGDLAEVPPSPDEEETFPPDPAREECWCGGEVGPREPGGFGCLESVWHVWDEA